VVSEAYGKEAMKKTNVYEWHKRPKKSHMSKSHMKKMPTPFFNIRCAVHSEFIPQGQTVNQDYYVEILKWLREAMHRKRPELWFNNWILHHDIFQLTQHSVKQFLAQKSITEMEHLTYSPNLALNDF
jgi:hypothetical protein